MLICGDCIDGMDIFIDDNSVDLVLADPPYGTTACKWDTVIPFEPMWEQLLRVTKAKAAIVLMASQPFTTSLISSNMKMFKYCWVWDKKIGSNFASAGKMPLKITEDVVVFGGCNYYPQKTKGKMRQKGGGKQFVGVYGEKNSSKVSEPYWSDDYQPTNIIQIGNAKRSGKVHPTQKPVKLVEYLIRTYSNEGDMVLDFTMGSGTTGVACKNLQREFIGIEKDHAIFKIAETRIEGCEK